MLVRLTFVKRYVRNGFLYRKDQGRVYRVDNDEGTELLQITVNDLPIFKMVTEESIGPSDVIIDLEQVDDEPPEVVKPAPKKKTVVKKPAAKKTVKKASIKKPKEDAVVVADEADDETDVEMV